MKTRANLFAKTSYTKKMTRKRINVFRWACSYRANKLEKFKFKLTQERERDLVQHVRLKVGDFLNEIERNGKH